MQATTDQITAREVARFFYRNRNYILTAVALGFLVAIIIVVVTPKSFEAKWQMNMAQVVVNNSSNSNSEEPAALIQRLRSNLTYPSEVLDVCDKSGEDEIEGYLGKSLQVQTVKNVPNAAEFKLRATSVEQVKACSNAIVAMVIAQQREIINERLAGKQEQLAQYQQSLKDEMRQLERLKKTELGNFGYLAMLDKLTWLRARIDGLQEELFLSQKYPAKLNVPIQVSRKPVSPNVPLVLVLGLLLGVMTGLLYAIGREGWHKQMSEA